MNGNKYSQRGVTLTGLIFWGIIIALLAVLGMKVSPHVIEFYKVKNVMSAIVSSGQAGSVADVRAAFDRRADTDYIETVKSSDIEVTKVGNSVVLSIAYSRQIPLFGPVSLLIDFEASTDK